MARRSPRSAPPGRDVLRRVRERLAGGWPAGLTVLSGDDLYHLDAAQRALIAALVPQEATAFALTVVGETKTDVGQVVAAARSVGMFAPARVVLVRDVQALDGDPAPLAEFARRPPPNAFVLVRAPVLDRRRKLHQLLASAGTLLAFGTPADPRTLAGELLEIAAEKGLGLEREAAALLAEVCGGDLYRVDGELEKIRVWLGGTGKARVDVDTVRETAAGSGLLSGWEASDAFLARDLSRALEALRRLAEAGEEPLKILGGLAYRARGMLGAKVRIERGASPDRAAAAAKLWGVPPSALAAGISRWELRELVGLPGALLEADRDLKSRRISGWAVIEATIARAMVGEAGGAG